jgi:histidinol-phosphatase (PHP family)
MRDYHVHSNYSDGAFLFRMIAAAEDAGLDAVGVADHCILPASERQRHNRNAVGFTLDATHERRRAAINRLDERHDLEVYDAVEMDYDTRAEENIADFLADAGFDYAIGSVHSVDDTFVQWDGEFADMDDGELDAFVDDYYDALVALVESELFAIAAHPDLVERTESLRGRSTVDHYRRVADAFTDSRTVPELNAGRALRDIGVVHPADEFLEALLDRGVDVTLGTDAHAPEELGPRADFLSERVADLGTDPISPFDTV